MNFLRKKETWCEFWQATGAVLCLQHATIWLPLRIGEDDTQEMHGFCEYHAGMVIGMLANQLRKEGEI